MLFAGCALEYIENIGGKEKAVWRLSANIPTRILSFVNKPIDRGGPRRR